jgi:apolipoprotein N-acyltransferase
MRTFGLIALVLVLLVMGWLSTRQVAMVPASARPAGAASAAANVAEQSRQIQRQVQQQLDSALQTTRDLPGDAK